MNRARAALSAEVVLRRLVGLAFATLVLATTVAVAFDYAARSFSPPSEDRPGAQLTVTDWQVRALDDPGMYNPEVGLDLAAIAGTSRTDLLTAATRNSTVLILLAEALALAVGIPAGLLLGIARSRTQFLLVLAVGVLTVVPAYFAAFLLQIVAVQLAGASGRTVLPVFGFGTDSHLVIPVLALAVAPAAALTRIVATATAAKLREDWVRTAHAKGLPRRVVIFRHLLPNLRGTLSAGALAALQIILGSLVIVEYLVVWPGLGWLTLRALRAQDLLTLIPAVTLLGLAATALRQLVGRRP